MSLLVFLVLGVSIGWFARALLPHLGVEAPGTVPAVVAGSVAGGVLVSLVLGLDLVAVQSVNLVGSLAGALTVLGVTIAMGRRVGA
jgi:uncharacterized membrane protein YeaQ/YmgE (transglycosylase-associated protein family)